MIRGTARRKIEKFAGNSARVRIGPEKEGTELYSWTDRLGIAGREEGVGRGEGGNSAGERERRGERERERGLARARERVKEERQRRYGAKAARVVGPAGQSCCGGNHDA